MLAYEIHDGFVQPATAALMNLQAGLAAHTSDPEQALENVARGVQLLQESIAEVRWVISGLRPVVLEDQGLVAAVDKLVHDTESRTEIRHRMVAPSLVRPAGPGVGNGRVPHHPGGPPQRPPP